MVMADVTNAPKIQIAPPILINPIVTPPLANARCVKGDILNTPIMVVIFVSPVMSVTYIMSNMTNVWLAPLHLLNLMM